MFFIIISATDGVDVWHLRLDQEQLDSHVRISCFFYVANIINNDDISNIIIYIQKLLDSDWLKTSAFFV